MATWITVCETCRHDGWREGEGERPGARLAALVETAAAGTGLCVRRTACLMGCDHGCNLAVQAAGKLAYVLGRLAPEREAAEAVVAWARLHAASATGQVPYRDWPPGVKGHFISRMPPLPPDPPEET